MRAVSRSLVFPVVALLAVACGGSDPPAKEPESVATPLPTKGTTSAGSGPMVTAGTISAANPPPAPAPAPAPTTSSTPPMRADGPCDLCAGRVTPELQDGLTKRASEARDCYVRVLTNTPNAKASMTIEVKVGRDGTACSVQAKVGEPSYPGLADCVMDQYKKGGFAPPGAASCVVTRVPIEFTPAK